jgi:Uma2 family endonuclease
MRGGMLEVPDHVLEQRRISGADQWDEMWDGVLHMVPSPSVEQQDFEALLETWLRRFWKPRKDDYRVYHQVALSPDKRWVKNYRTPDVVLFTADHLDNLKPTYCHGACTVAIEVRTPNDESYEKLDFYAQIGVPEVWIIDRDTKRPEVHCLKDKSYVILAAGSAGFIRSQVTNIRLLHNADGLSMCLVDRDETLEQLKS